MPVTETRRFSRTRSHDADRSAGAAGRDGLRFLRAATGITGKRLTYAELIGAEVEV
jgi:hypothetical protein